MQGYNNRIYVSFGLAQPKTTELARQLVSCCRTDSFFGDGVSSRRSTSMRDQSQCETTGSHIAYSVLELRAAYALMQMPGMLGSSGTDPEGLSQHVLKNH